MSKNDEMSCDKTFNVNSVKNSESKISSKQYGLTDYIKDVHKFFQYHSHTDEDACIYIKYDSPLHRLLLLTAHMLHIAFSCLFLFLSLTGIMCVLFALGYLWDKIFGTDNCINNKGNLCANNIFMCIFSGVMCLIIFYILRVFYRYIFNENPTMDTTFMKNSVKDVKITSI